MSKVKGSDYVYGRDTAARIGIITAGFVGIKVATSTVGDFFDSTSTKMFLGAEKYFDEHLGGNKINIFIDSKVQQLHKIIGS